MKEIKVTRTIEEVGYEANDGTTFKTKEECLKYEQSAEAAITMMFENICVKHYGRVRFDEDVIFANYCSFSDDFFVIADIKTEADLKIANMYGSMWAGIWCEKLTSDRIGKRVLINLGCDSNHVFCSLGTEEEMVEEFRMTMERFFRPEESI